VLRVHCSCLFGVVLEDPLPLCHPFVQTHGIFRWIVVLGAIKFAGRPRKRLHFAGTLESDFLIEVQPVRDVSGDAFLQKNGKCEAIFDSSSAATTIASISPVASLPHN
jgi:hypothetical protein